MDLMRDYVSGMECATADYEPWHGAIRPEWCALGTLTKHNGELSWARDKRWHDESVSVGFCGQDVFANIIWCIESEIWVRNEELKDSLPSPHTHCMWWNGKSSPSSSLLVQSNPVQWQCDKPVSYFCTVLPHNSWVACTNHQFSMLLLVLLSPVCMKSWIKFLWTSSAVRQHAKQRKMHTR